MKTKKTFGNPVTPRKAVEPESLKLTEDEVKALNLLDEGVLRAKLGLADLAMLMLQVEQKRNAGAQSVVNASKAYTDRVGAIAKEHGIDVDDPSKGRWNFDSKTSIFTRIG